MAAEEQTSRQGVNGGDVATRWGRVGRQLLADQLERGAGALRSEMYAAASKLQNGEELDAEEIKEMREAMQTASYALQLAEEACAETTPRPDPFLYLDEEGRREYAKDAKSLPEK